MYELSPTRAVPTLSVKLLFVMASDTTPRGWLKWYTTPLEEGAWLATKLVPAIVTRALLKMVIAPPTSGDVLLIKVQLTKAAALMTEPKAIAPPVVPVADLLRN